MQAILLTIIAICAIYYGIKSMLPDYKNASVKLDEQEWANTYE